MPIIYFVVQCTAVVFRSLCVIRCALDAWFLARERGVKSGERHFAMVEPLRI